MQENGISQNANTFYFSKIDIVFYRIRQENTNFTVSFPG